jgi:putative PEP-CTERM system TPR-repeat lipoprotein
LLGQVELAMAANKPDEAMALARGMQKSVPKSPLGFVLEGDLLSNQKKYEQAVRAYEQADALAKNGPSTMKLAAALSNAGKAKEGEAKVTAYLATHPTDTTMTRYLAEQLLARKDYKGASKYFEGLLAQAPNDPALLNNLAWAYQQQKDPRALSFAERAAKAAPESGAVLDTLGWLLVEQGNTARALPLLQKAVSLEPNARDLRYHLAAALAKSGDKKTARQELDKALVASGPFAQQDEAKELLKSL